MKPNCFSSYSNNPESCYNNNTTNGDSAGSNRIRVVRLRRRNNLPLGFSIRGGREHGTGVFVSEVRAGSEAHHQGLLVGDQILRINGFNIEHAIHDEVLALLRAKPGVVIKVKSMGMIPVKDTKKDPLTWKIVDPGPSSSEQNEKDSEDQCVETRITIPVIGSGGLGCSIVKGPPDLPGIYVQSVKSGGLAEKAGLQVGDRIVEMNGRDFSDIDFPEAVAALKSSKQMSLLLLKCAGSHLFAEEKLRRSAGKEDEKKLSCVEEEESRDESRRDTKTMNGHSDRVKSVNEHKHLRDGLVSLNGNSSSSDVSSKQVMNGVPSQNKYSHKVHATVHSSPCDDDHVNNKFRGAGDGMDYEIMNGHKNASRNSCSWDGDFHEPKADPSEIRNVCCSPPNGNSLSEDDSCSSFSSSKETYVSSNMNSVNGMSSLTNESGDKTSSVTSDEKSELSSISSDDYPSVSKSSSRPENAKPQNEVLKRKQHELLMEEFREVHKKMFGQGLPKVVRPPKQTNGDLQDGQNPSKRRQQMRKDKHVPPPPPPDFHEYGSNKENNYPQIDEEDHENNCSMNSPVITYRRRQREPPITDSRKSDPKPPHTYFEKKEPIVKPLVTIGTYSNSQQQNRFLSGVSCRTKDLASTLASDLAYIDQHMAFTSSSASSLVPSSSSSEPRSPTSESILSSDSAFGSSSPLINRCTYLENAFLESEEVKKVPNALKIASHFDKNSKKVLEKTDQGMKLPIRRHEDKTHLAVKQNQNSKGLISESLDELLLKEAEGRDIKKVILKKNGPLNFTIEGGINSDLGGKIKVSEILPGNCTTQGGNIEVGDQILMVDNTRLTGLSLTAANVALRNANSNSNIEMKLVVAKFQKQGGTG